MRKKILVCDKCLEMGMFLKRQFNATEYSMWNCTMNSYDVKKHIDKRAYDVVVMFALDNRLDVGFNIALLSKKHPETAIIVVVMRNFDYKGMEHYYAMGASLCLWLREITMPTLANFIRLQLFHQSHPDVNIYISTFLANHGFTSFHKGFYYLCTALDLCLKEPERLNRVVQDVYGEIAVRCAGSDYNAVERIMRYYLDKALASPTIDPLLKRRYPTRPPLKKFLPGLCQFYNDCSLYPVP